MPPLSLGRVHAAISLDRDVRPGRRLFLREPVTPPTVPRFDILHPHECVFRFDSCVSGMHLVWPATRTMPYRLSLLAPSDGLKIRAVIPKTRHVLLHAASGPANCCFSAGSEGLLPERVPIMCRVLRPGWRRSRDKCRNAPASAVRKPFPIAQTCLVHSSEAAGRGYVRSMQSVLQHRR